ncbi:HNH endonuclease [Sodalis sp. RH24]|uniref:HNH endonuclease n=1 Tax=unclassified Sodalis (in: enterobacteria) TaxID=2636512 RepID=UPI0039B40A65
MATYDFVVGNSYTKNDLYTLCRIPVEKQKGSWNTGYTQYDGDWFIFCNIGIPGRTGHNYGNRFVGDDLLWYGKTDSHINQPSIKSMRDGIGNNFIFYRTDDRSPFTFAGTAKAIQVRDIRPVEILWGFLQSGEQRVEVLAQEEVEPEKFYEGATKTISVNIYERNPQARRLCIDKHGVSCAVCGFNFAKVYGEIGKGFIHVHHLKPLAGIGAEYQLDPVEDLRPVCPNCHAMLHRRKPPYSINELTELLKDNISQ